MKINYFYGSISIREKDGYTENLEFNATESKGLTIRYPYGDATTEETYAISTFIRTVNEAYNTLVNQIDNVNRDLHLEQYAPVSESTSESTEVSAVPQSCALGDEEEDKLAVLKTALKSNKPLKGEESKELEPIVGE